MSKKLVLKVAEDFYQKDLRVGDEIGQFGGRLKIINLSYKNEFGNFILCEYTDNEQNEDVEDHWERRMGKRSGPNKSLEIVGSIHIPGYRNMLGGIGFFIKNHDIDEVMGVTYQQAWNLIYHEGARNVEASSSHYQQFSNKLIDTIDGLPSLDSYFWKISAFDAQGKPYAPFTKEALAKINKGIGNAVDGLIRERLNLVSVPYANEDFSDMNEICQLLKSSKKIVILSGAGISTHSGIPDYRSYSEGMWRKNPQILEHLNQAAFEHEPEQFWNAMYDLIQQTLLPITPFPTHEALLATINGLKPNGGHRFLSWLDTELKKDVTIITQNVDGLDGKAGSKHLIEMHGNILECFCPECKRVYPLVEVLTKNGVPSCECSAVLRPNVVFFGDEVRHYNLALAAVQQAEVILIVGTSLQVYPFNQLIDAKGNHAKVVLLNESPLGHDAGFDYTAYGDISKMFYKIKGLLEEK